MAKTKTQNAGMAVAGTYPSQLAYGGFQLSTEHPGFAPALEDLASALGLNPKGAFYLLQYGFAQSMGDSIAGMGKKLDDAKDEGGTPKFSDVEKKVALHDAMQERLNAIVAGDVGHRGGGPRVKGLERVMQDVAWSMIEDAARAKGVKLPAKAAERAPLIAGLIAKAGERIKAEAERRMAQPSGDVADVLDGLI